MKIKELREKIGISQRQLAIKLNITPQNLNRYENGTNEPNIETLCKIADFFNVSVDELLERKTENVNLNFTTDLKRELIIQILNSSENLTEKLNAYLQGMLTAEKERLEIMEQIKKLKERK